MRRDSRYRYQTNDHPDHLEVHDLDNEKTGTSQCQIDEIQNSRYLIGTTEADLKVWLRNNPGYDGCMYCLPHLHRK